MGEADSEGTGLEREENELMHLNTLAMGVAAAARGGDKDDRCVVTDSTCIGGHGSHWPSSIRMCCSCVASSVMSHLCGKWQTIFPIQGKRFNASHGNRPTSQKKVSGNVHSKSVCLLLLLLLLLLVLALLCFCSNWTRPGVAS
jgi:hypothetical protein